MSHLSRGSMPRPSEEAKVAFQSLLPADPTVAVKPMFGNVSAFVNGNMFAGLFGDDLFVRLPDDERESLMAKGGKEFEPMPGRAMRGYVTVPAGWQRDQASAKAWIANALNWCREMPAKELRSRRS